MSKTGRKLWLIRHGYRQDYVDPQWPQTALHPADPPLSRIGLLQAQDLIDAFAEIQPDSVFVSPYLRTLQTVKPMAEAHNLRVKVEDGLGEIHQSQGSASPFSVFPAQRETLVPQIDADYTSLVIPDQLETPQLAMRRSAKTAIQLLRTFEGNLALITHESPIKGIVKHLVSNATAVRCSFCGVTELECQSTGWHLIRNGDVGHLSSPTTKKRFLYDYARRQMAQLLMAM